MYDLLILGSGPAGIAASIYAYRYRLKTLTIGEIAGGTITEAHDIENYPGVGKITGIKLGDKMIEQAKNLGCEIINEKVQDVKKITSGFEVQTGKEKYKAKRILIATGCERKRLVVPGEERLTGRGVSYCAACDGFFFKKKKVAVIGGGDAAITSAIYLADIAEKVTLIIKKTSFHSEPYWIEKLKAAPNVKILTNSDVRQIDGEEKVESITLKNGRKMKLDGVFIEVGSNPNDLLLTQLGVKRDNDGYIFVNKKLKTNKKGVWAAGDVTHQEFKFRQIVTAAAEGALAAYSIFLDTKKKS